MGPASCRTLRWLIFSSLATLLAPRGWALPEDRKVQLGTWRDGAIITAGDLRDGVTDFAGAVLEWRADLRGARCRGASFQGADLSGCMLDGAELSGANLQSADLREASLKGVELTGALLQGVNLTRADLTGARLPEGSLLDPSLVLKDTVGPDGVLLNPSSGAQAAPGPVAEGTGQHLPPWRPPAEAEALPGAQPDPGEADASAPLTTCVEADLKAFFNRKQPVGTVQQIALAEAMGELSQSVAVPSGVAWLSAGGQAITILRPDGCLHVSTGARMLELGASDDRIWFITATNHLYLTPPATSAWLKNAKRGVLTQWTLPDSLVEQGTGRLAFVKDRIWLLGIGGTCMAGMPIGDLELPGLAGPKPSPRFGAKKSEDILLRTFAPDSATRIQAGPNGELVFNTETGFGYADAVALRLEDRGTLDTLDCGVEPRFTAMTRSGTFLVLSPDRELLLVFDPRTDAMLKRGPFFKERLKVGGVAEGPSGLIWFTEPANNTIGRLDPGTGRILRFPLPEPGLEPTHIINGGNGLMYFTMAGRQRLGAIVADADGLDRPPVKAAQAATAVPGAEAKAARPNKQERARLRKREKKAAAALSARSAKTGGPVLAEAEAGAEVEAAESAGPEPDAEASLPGPAAEAVPPRPVLLDHILQEHSWGAPNGKGQFLEAAAPETIRSLIQEALSRREAPLVLTVEGRWEAHCTFRQPVGFYLDWRSGGWKSTATLRVILDAAQATVVTAFPVRR